MVCGTHIWGSLKERKGTGEDAWGDSLRFTAYPYDPVVGKHFAHARVYDGTLGRMYAKDPVKQGLNGYVYCDNDPADYTDPEGELGHIAAAAGGGAIFGGISGFISSAVSQHMMLFSKLSASTFFTLNAAIFRAV